MPWLVSVFSTTFAGSSGIVKLGKRIRCRTTTMHSGDTLNGDVYLYVGTLKGPLFIVYRPDDHVAFSSSQSTGVWRIG
jgi:hypothetical protein